jgi:hypothetical protein
VKCPYGPLHANKKGAVPARILSARADALSAPALAVALALLLATVPAALPAGTPGGAAAALAETDCSGAREAAERKIARDKEREAERRRGLFPELDPEAVFRKCLGGIMAAPAAGVLPPLPDLNDALDQFCRAAREGMGNPTLSPSGSFGLAPDKGANTALPWTGGLNEDIWNALRQGY